MKATIYAGINYKKDLMHLQNKLNYIISNIEFFALNKNFKTSNLEF